MNKDFDLGWNLLEGQTPYFIKPIELSSREKRILSLLLERLLQNPSVQMEVALRELCGEKNIVLERVAGGKLVAIAKKCVEGFGVLDFILADDEVEEISVIGVNKPIFVFHRSRGWLESNALFTSQEHAVDTINKIARPLGRRVSFQNPRLNAFLPDGSRLHASIAPICLNGVELTIRKFKKQPFTAKQLASLGTFSLDALAFLWTVLFADVSLCIAGNTGSGKTTTLNALFSFIPLGERIVVTEETPELNLVQEHVVKIIANDELGITMKDLVKDTLRMRPDRIVIGEVRSRDEAHALFDSLLAGQAKGSCFTMHANSSAEVLQRLRAFGIAQEDLNAIDLVLVQKRISFFDKCMREQKELRRVTELAEITDGKPRVLFYLNPRSGFLEKTTLLRKSRLVQKVLQNYSFTEKEFWNEVFRRKKFLERTSNETEFKTFTEQVQDFAFSKERPAVVLE